jgi:uncharacterized protein (TIGR02270 family)
MSQPDQGGLPEDRVLWDVVEEHLAEAEFLLEQLERAFNSPTLTLKTLESGVEARLLAHVDGLVLGGSPVYERLLKPVLDAPDPDQATLVTAAGLVAVESGRLDDLRPALGHEVMAVRVAMVNACALSASARLDAWVLRRLPGVMEAVERASLLRIAARRGLKLPTLLEWLQGDDPRLVMAAAEAARHADPRRHLAVTEHLLDHEDEGVREAALIAALAWGSRRASVVCEQLALAVDAPRALPMALYAALGGPERHKRLARKLTVPTQRRSALFALGFSGNPEQLPVLLQHLSDPDPIAAKIAAQAISTITGIDLTDDAFAAKPAGPPPQVQQPAGKDDAEAQRSLPPLGEDNLDADLVPVPEDDLPTPDAAAIRRFCEQPSSKLPDGRRFVHGKPLTAEAVLDSLEGAPLRRRHVLALWLGILTGARAWVDTRTGSREQRRQIAVGRAGS